MILSAGSYKQLRFQGHSNTRTELPTTQRETSHERHADGPKLAGQEQRLVELVLAGVGLSTTSYRSNPLRRRLTAVLRATRAPTVHAAIAKLAYDEACLRRAVDALLIGHTASFRDSEVFSTLEHSILPSLARRNSRPLRVWSLGCSTGEELLSVAVLLTHFGQQHGGRLRGSDCRPAAIEQARRRVDAFWSSVPLPLTERFSPAAVGHFRALAQGIEWRVEDILSCPMRGQWDLVLCRNLAIYLEPSVSIRLWKRIEDCLAPGGVLVTGKAERPSGCQSLRRIAKCIYRAEEG